MKKISLLPITTLIRHKMVSVRKALRNISKDHFELLLEEAKEGNLPAERLADIVGFITEEQEKRICKIFIDNCNKFIKDQWTRKCFMYLIEKSIIFSELVILKYRNREVKKDPKDTILKWLIKQICKTYPQLIKNKVTEKTLPSEYLRLIPTS